MGITLILILLCQCGQVLATNYYVDNVKGKDSFNGKSPATAWKSVSKVNSKSFQPGDTIFFKRGCVWRETLSLTSSGIKGKNIVFSNYGKGPKPRFLGSTEVKTWSAQNENVWKSVESVPLDPYNGYYKGEIFFVTGKNPALWGRHRASLSDLKENLDWTWFQNYVFIYSDTDPNKEYSSTEVPQRQQCINLKNKTNILIDGLDLYFTRWSGISYDWSFDMLDLSGLTIQNSEMGWIGSKYLLSGYGTEMAYTDMTFRHDTIHDCGRRGISLDIYGSGFTVKNVIIEGCVFYSGMHTTGIDLSVGSDKYTASYDGVIIRGNLFYDDPATTENSNQIFLQNHHYAGGGATVNNILIYSNVFKYPSSTSIMAEGIQSCNIYNNTFYDHNTIKGQSVCHLWIDAHNTNIKVKNNIFYTELTNDHLGNGIAITSLTDASEIDADYNLYYRKNSNMNIINCRITFNSNALAGIRKILKWDMHSFVSSDPLFKDPSTNDFSLKNGSPAIGAGIPLPEVKCDFSGNLFSTPPSLGAFEHENKSLNKR